jgi:hypothetical protein
VAIVQAIDQLDLPYPKVDGQKKEGLTAARAALARDK